MKENELLITKIVNLREDLGNCRAEFAKKKGKKFFAQKEARDKAERLRALESQDTDVDSKYGSPSQRSNQMSAAKDYSEAKSHNEDNYEIQRQM